MKLVRRILVAAIAAGCSLCGFAQASPECASPELLDHVLLQFDLYGPRSAHEEYFGFIYRSRGVIASAVVHSGRCGDPGNCTINTRRAAKLIPNGAKVLGEWHTHPRNGSPFLSTLDVMGAYANRKIRCYLAFYSQPDGQIQSWDPQASSVPIAMHSLVRLGAFGVQPDVRFVQDDPGGG